MDLRDEVAITYRDSIKHLMQDEKDTLWGDVDASYVCDEKKSTDKDISRNTATL